MKRYAISVFILLVVTSGIACGASVPKGSGAQNATGTVTSVYEISKEDMLRDTSDWEWRQLQTWKTDNFEIDCSGSFRYSYQNVAYPIPVDQAVVATTDELTMFFYESDDGKLYMHIEVNSSE